MSQPFAVFDIDGTLIRWQLYHAIVTELANQGYLTAEAGSTIQAARMTWKKRSHSNSFLDYEHVLVETYNAAIKNLTTAQYQQAVNDVFEEYKDQVYTYTRDLIRSLKAKNYLLFAISGSHQEIIAKLAAYYGFDDYVGVQFERKNGRFTGKYDSPFGKKAQLLKEMIIKNRGTIKGSVGVGDSASDADMLEIVEQPIAFNPEQKLFNIAKERGWKIVVERKNMIYKLKLTNENYVLQ